MTTSIDPEEISCNDSPNPGFESVLERYLSRRGVLQGGLGAAATLLLGGGLAACGGSGSRGATATRLELNFHPVAKSVADALAIPDGYTASIVYATGDPLAPGVPEYANDGSDDAGSFVQRSGDQHDGMAYFGLGADGRFNAGTSDRGLICINHENITQVFLHPGGPTMEAGVRTVADEVRKEINAHGLGVFEVARAPDGSVSLVRDSRFNRRITPDTPAELRGPVAGSAYVRTPRSADGTTSHGTLNNCGSGPTPWGTYLTSEENWAMYFRRAAGDDAARSDDGGKAVRGLQRYGMNQGAEGFFRWASATSSDPADVTFRRWDASRSGSSADGSDDFRNEPNTFGYMVELDPFQPTAPPRKRTAMGRFAHESGAHCVPVAGQPMVFYMGDDSPNEYVYKFVSATNWSPADVGSGLAAGDKYLDSGTLYVARFNDDGSGDWLPLTMANPVIADYTGYAFADQADICVHARIAADAVGATKMDRPEWTAVNPRNGEMYVTLTNNSRLTMDRTTAANPRSYGSRGGNANGHIIRLAETGSQPSATSFRWDVYLFGAPATADADNVNLSALADSNDFSSPDGLWFDRRGICWIQTDDQAYTDTSNCMMLAAVPGSVGDGRSHTIVNTVGGNSAEQGTHVGAPATEANLRRFLVGPVGCEITGITATPDLRTLFVNIQHPGEYTTTEQLLAGESRSSWPGGGSARPRSATLAIRRNDGGPIGADEI